PPLFARLCRASAAVPSPNLRLGDWSVVPRLRRRYGALPPTPALRPAVPGFGGGTFPQPLVGGLVRGSPPPAAVRRRFPLPPLFARLCPASAAVPSPTSWGTDPVGQFPVRT